MQTTVTNPYRQLFAAPGSLGFALAGLLARLPLPMTGIGIITLLAQVRGSYALAGAVAATFVLTYALLSPQVSRLVDRHGQRRVLPLATGVSVAGLLLLLGASWWEAPTALLFVGALLAGAMPSMSAMVRARWTAIYRGQRQLQTAYALETVFDEVTFIAGPPLSIGLAVAVLPHAGVLAAAVLLPIGVVALIAQRRTEPPIIDAAAPAARRDGSVMRLLSVRWLALLMVAMGVIVGTVDVVSVAFAAHVGQPAAASLVLSAYAAGSCLSGVMFGALKLQAPLHRWLLLGGLATALTTLPLWWAGKPVRLGRGGVRGRRVLRTDHDRGDVADRAAGAGASVDRRHDLAAGGIERRCRIGCRRVRPVGGCPWGARGIPHRGVCRRRGAAGRDVRASQVASAPGTRLGGCLMQAPGTLTPHGAAA